jgi:hypothetical protein
MTRALVLALMLTPALLASAQAAELTDLTATRTGDDQVRLTFTFEGGACQEIEAPASGGITETEMTVIIPSRNTGEICTMQIVPIPVDVTVNAFPEMQTVHVQVLGPNRETQAEGIAQILP